MERTGDTRTYLYEPRAIPFSYVPIKGKPHLLFAGESFPAASGQPHMPVQTLTLGVPQDAEISAELRDPVYETLSGQQVAPEPVYVPAENSESEPRYEPDVLAYARDTFLPQVPIQTSAPFRLRSQRVVTIRVAPYQYNPARKALRKLKRATILLRYRSGVPGAPQKAAGGDPVYEDVYKNILDNYEEARQWRSYDMASATRRDSTGDWFEAGRTYYRIPIADDGWYRVTPADMVSAGINPALIDTATLRIIYKGRHVPLHVRPDYSVEFFGRENRGDSTYTNDFSDTSAYWMTWGGIERGERYAEYTGTTGPLPDTIASSLVTRHYEENTDYYEGTGQSEVIDNGPVRGEGWAWEYYYPGSSLSHGFQVDYLDSVSGPLASLKIRLQSTTLNYNVPDHRALFWVNDSLAGTAEFTGRQGVSAEISFPARWLRNGQNTLRIYSEPTPSSPNQFYLDWYEVSYRRFHVAAADRLVMDTPASRTPDGSIIRATGFSGGAVDVYDLTSNRLLQGVTVDGDSIVGYSVKVRCRFDIPTRLLIVGSGGASMISSISPKIFKDLRSSQTGADYIVVTHTEFLSAAERLAAHRASTGGLRTAVVTVQDIYDEFNYGHLHTAPIKEFLRHAYTNWAGPPPAAVVFLGDASWDYRKYMSTTTKENFVPAYGVPAGDNWYVCFDSLNTFIPSMLAGRVPVQSEIQADRTVDKIIRYGTGPVAEWNKSFLFISGGTSPEEQSAFNSLTNLTIDQYVSPPPIGGTPYAVYKSTPDAIDGEHKQYMKDLVKQGLVFINFLGHSGGRFWGVDIGSPNELENTGGELPFVSSVSCNISAFAEPSNNVLGEDFLMADNRGAIASWGSSSLGYATIGASLVNLFLDGVTVDSIRGLGNLTTSALIRLWQMRGSDYVTIASVNLNPLLGDPLTRLALPLKPELVVRPGGLTSNASSASPDDSVLTVRLDFSNYGLVPPDSVAVSLTDTYGGIPRQLLTAYNLPPTHHRDSVLVPWRAVGETGAHTLAATLDPAGRIVEVDETNNVISATEYVYRRGIVIVKPFDFSVVAAGSQTLVVTALDQRDTLPYVCEFELDTVDTFDSPVLVQSGPVTSGPVEARWTTPVLASGGVFFWRVRTVRDSVYSRWEYASVSTSPDAPVLPAARWRQSSRPQFARNQLAEAAVGDTGTIIAPRPPLSILARSVGYRASMDRDYYSILRVQEQTMIGYWWVNGSGFMTARADEQTGIYEFRAFNVPAQAAKADEMATYLNRTKAGETVAITVIFDGYTNVNANLLQAIHTLGSTMIDSVRPGHSWMLIARRDPVGNLSPVLEQWSPDGIALDSLTLENYYTVGTGRVTTGDIPVPHSWGSVHVRGFAVPPLTSVQTFLLGVSEAGVVDTLEGIDGVGQDVTLSHLTTDLAADSTLAAVRLGARLSTGVGLSTPSLKEWWLDFEPPQELAISSRSITVPSEPVVAGDPLELSVSVTNLGYRLSDSATVSVFLNDPAAPAYLAASAVLDPLPPDASRLLRIPVPTAGLKGKVVSSVSVSLRPQVRELLADNNMAWCEFEVAGLPQPNLLFFSDGTQLVEGDYVAVKPAITVRVANVSFDPARERMELFVDNTRVGSVPAPAAPDDVTATGGSADDPVFTPELTDGSHELRALLIRANLFAPPDTSSESVSVKVQGQYGILNLFNYPNPFQTNTEFTFVLTGARPPDEVRIRIYTVAGRKIHQIVVPGSSLQIGFNRIPWDGRDAEGDEVANGVYLYQVELRAAGGTQTETGRMVRLR